MTWQDILTLLGGLAMFLFGMSLMSSALEKRAGSQLKTILSKLTTNPFKGFLLGLVVTLIVQSSSATTVMVVGFVNSGIMTLGQAAGVIYGANLGASVTAWLLSLTGISDDASFLLQLCKPSTFTPILAFVGIVMYMFMKKAKFKDTGMILLGFAILMFGMDTMSGSVEGLNDNAAFTGVLTMFGNNPILGTLVGAGFTAIIQSSGASVGILQALSNVGLITYSAAVPIIMGQNIGTCISAAISSIGANANAKRASVIHTLFNVIATLVLLPIFYLVSALFADNLPILQANASPVGIAFVHTGFKILALLIITPFSKQLTALACKLVPDKKNQQIELLDERLLATPSVAVERCRVVTVSMAKLAVNSLKESFPLLNGYNEKTCNLIREQEAEVDRYEDMLGTYLVKLSSQAMGENDSEEATKLLHLIGDFERISDHAVNIVESAEEMHDKKLVFSAEAKQEMNVLIGAVTEILDLALVAFDETNLDSAALVEPLEEVIDHLKKEIRRRHTQRLQKNECTIELGFVYSDLIVNLERVADHCSNIAACLMEIDNDKLSMHEYIENLKTGTADDFNNNYQLFSMKYAL